MTSNSDTLDERVMTLVAMGFDLEDCQLAFQNGKLRVEDALDWLLNGKPQSISNSSTTLQLHLNQNNDMDTGPSVSNESPSVDVDTSMDMNTEDSQFQSTDINVASRLFVSDEQRRVKLQFEEKQRHEARRLAVMEKQAKKKAHEEAMKKIQEDRENRKKQSTSSNIFANSASVSTPLAHVAIPQNGHLSSGGPETSLIQIRLPSGEIVKHLFSGGCIFKDVFDFVSTRCSTSSFLLIQPFPRVEFTEEFFHKTLKELHLVPTGSLVLKISSAATTVVPDVRPLDLSTNAAENEAQPMQPPLHSLETGQQPAPDEEEDMEPVIEPGGVEEDAEIPEVADNLIDDDDEDNHAGNNPAHGMGQPPGAMPGFGRGRGLYPVHPVFPGGGMGGFGRGQAGLGFGQHNWGDGQRLTGEILPNVALPHQNQAPRQLAAEAASRRHVTEPPPSTTSGQGPVAHSTPSVDISSLRLLVIKCITADICSTRPTFYGLHGIPASLGLQILNNLVKEGLLRPKILHYFISCHLNYISLDSYPYCTNELLAALRHHIYLKTVSLKGCSFINHHGLQYLVVLKNLKYLNLSSCRKISDEVIPILIAIPSLVTVNLEDTAVTNAGVIQYASSQPPHLQNLDVGQTSVTQDCLVALQAIPCLKQLNLEQTQVTGLAGIEGLSQLRTLNLANTSLVTESVLCLRNLPALTVLNLANNVNINGDMALQYISELRLTHLQLPNRITTTDQGMGYLTNMPLAMLDLTNFIYLTDVSLEYIGRIVTLRKLRLSNTKITDSGIPFLEGLRDLEELQIDRTLLTDVGARIVTAFPRLLELNLSHTGVTNKFLISGALNSCRQLTNLNLSSTDVSDKGLVRLQLPQLSMLNIDGTYCQPDVAQRLLGCPLVSSVTFRALRIPPKNEDF